VTSEKADGKSKPQIRENRKIENRIKNIMSKKNKALVYNLLSFGILFVFIRYVLIDFTSLTGFMRPLTAFVVATILAPKFQAGNVGGTEKIVMKWIFLKGVKEVK